VNILQEAFAMKKNQHNGMLPNRRVRVPFLNSAEHHRPIADCVLNAAEASGITPLEMALYMNHFFQQIPQRTAQRAGRVGVRLLVALHGIIQAVGKDRRATPG
jgi:hypothetical protein